MFCALPAEICQVHLRLSSQVSVEEGDDRAKAEGIMFIETSAKGGFNIKVGTYRHTPLGFGGVP